MEELGFFAAIIAAFAFGTIWFYTACVITFFGIMVLVENEHEILSIGVLAVFVVLMQNSGAFNIFNDPLMLLKWSLLYFVIGTVWSFVKWWAFLTKRAEEFGEMKDLYREKTKKLHPTDSEPSDKYTNTGTVANPSTEFVRFLRLKSFLSEYPSDYRATIIPTALLCKAKITGWIIWWPTSVLWTIISDPMVRIANYIFSRLKGTYQLIANKVFAKFDEA